MNTSPEEIERLVRKFRANWSPGWELFSRVVRIAIVDGFVLGAVYEAREPSVSLEDIRRLSFALYEKLKPQDDEFVMMTPEELFEAQTGHKPERDDVERANCKLAGELGHGQCGVCDVHHQPRTICGCFLQARKLT